MVLVESYVAMRAESMQSYRAAPRVTIRQLESLIRLSEAVAKLKFSDVVLPNHVHEARRLIYACLLRLEKGTITLDDDSTDDTEDSQGEQDNQAEKKGASQQDLSFKRTLQTIDADEFERIAGTLIDHMRSLEAELKQTDILHVDAINAVEAVVAKDDLITWYIENCTDATSTQEDLEREFTKLNKVIKRMVNRDFTLIVCFFFFFSILFH
jgi:DNA replication licensing factor MCM6